LAAWLNIAFWIGQAIAAPVTGAFFAQNRYPAPMILAALLSALAAVLNLVLFLPVEHRLEQGAEIV
jgi:peptidoglycan biosynthesis protein MviN/MurJ (putative lipid II flippase)